MQTKKQLSISRYGITLLEVLAAVFVVSIGLLGVLAVIPFGAFQVSKAQHAEYASNMLANAVEEIFIRDMVNISPPTANEFTWVEPHENQNLTEPTHIFRYVKKDWQEIMRGQDDLVYTTYSDKRPDFAGQGNKIQSSGNYTWFFTSRKVKDKDTAAVDVLACYNRVPSDDQQVPILQNDFSPSFGGGTFTLPDASYTERFTQTKYVFVTWNKTGSGLDGAWCKIVFLDKLTQKIVVTGDLEGIDNNDDIQVYIPSGVLYHKRLADVPVK